jgi:hypothetical protein
MRGLRATRRRLGILVCAPTVAIAIGTSPALASGTSVGDVGAGYLTGSVQFINGTSVPTPVQICAPTSWTFTTRSSTTAGEPIGSAGIVIDVLPGDYEGLIDVEAAGSSGCATAPLETGTITSATANAVNPANTPPLPTHLSCGLNGPYFRVGTTVLLAVGGSCTIGGTTAPVTFLATGEFVPTSTIGAPVTAAEFAGGFAVVPGIL